MRAFVIVAAAVISMLGLGWYFANSQAPRPAPAVITQQLQPAPAAPLKAQAPSTKEVIAFESGAHSMKSHDAKTSAKDFAMPTDENEVVGKYVPRQMVYPKGPSADKHVPLDDDLLVMEERSEDRLSATR